MRVLGIDLAWGQGRPGVPPNETGVVVVDEEGTVLDAGWTRGVAETAAWMNRWAGPDALAMVDAPLIVTNPTGMRECDKEIGRRYGRWKVSANAANLGLPSVLGGVALTAELAATGWRVDDGHRGPRRRGRRLHECFPYLALVGVEAFGYATERPVYKRRPRHLAPAEFRVLRAANTDEIIRRLEALDDPPLRLRSHPVTARLLDEPTPLADRAAKHREDLLDAALCAWTGLLWLHHGLARCQVLGGSDTPATVVAPCRPSQRHPVRRHPPPTPPAPAPKTM